MLKWLAIFWLVIS
uniref:Uncharacterized protein n=1 Tax=Anguilla anguilla TaxID=7936 RepID=A0A0E9SVT1_ANGAN